MDTPSLLPVLPIRNAVIFPGASMPLVVGRPRSVGALLRARSKDGIILVVTQQSVKASDPQAGDLYRVGTVCKIENTVEIENSSYQLTVTGIARYRIADFVEQNELLLARGEKLPDVYGGDSVKTRALFNSLRQLAVEILDLLPGVGESISRLIDRLDDPAYLTNLCATYLNIPLQQKQALLEDVIVESRMQTLLVLMQKEREVLTLQRDIQEKMSERISKAQRDALLREQMHTIREELGEEGTEVSQALEKRLEEAKLPEDVRKIANDELGRLAMLPPAAAEYHVIRTYLEWLADMPWEKTTSDRIDLKIARKILDEDHYGLEQVKRRIIQYLAVAKLKNDLHGPILCLIGPPGVGKTSLGQSVARTLGRKFIRTSLGGVRDEAEIRGHRRTYIGAMPGRIIQNIKRAGVKNPLFMLDEIDKLGSSFQGDPASAMLEVLDPEQNKSFVDHYLDVPFDLSNVFFIATANMADTIPAPLRDRMEIIEVNGYTTLEKTEIARRYLIPRQLKAHGLTAQQVELPNEQLLKIINQYTREAGVRELSREIAAIFRTCAEDLVLGQAPPIIIDETRLSTALGPEKFFTETTEATLRPGVSTGLAWTPHGGDILFIEARFLPGTGKLTLTGSLGDVMKESAEIAMSIIRAESRSFLRGLPKIVEHGFEFDKTDVHIHVPSGAIPKDGPSAGITILTALASLLTGRAVDSKLGMTGEITLRGAILPIGGVKEKVLAAHRAGIAKVILPHKNKKDLWDVPDEVKSKMGFKFVSTVEEALREALGLQLDERSAA